MKKIIFQGLHNLVKREERKKKPKRVGRGESSGLGKTSGRGTKGQKARKSGNVRPGFEGGQNVLYRKLPKSGFTNVSRGKKAKIINLKSLTSMFNEGDIVDIESLVSSGLLKNVREKIKILGVGDINFSLKVRAHFISSAAKEKIENAQGTVEIIN